VAGALDRRITEFLRSPAVMRIKHVVRDAWWRLRRRSIAAPRLPDRVPSMLFVCKGNICRSPFAERLALRRLQEQGLHDVRVASAGYHAAQAARPPAHAVDVAGGYGVALDDHRPLAVTRELLEAHAITVVFEVEHVERLAREFPAYRDRLVLLPLYAAAAPRGYARYNIADPFGRPRDSFTACYAAIDDALSALIAALPRQRD
jgi:protein-tyrosine phosphatase